MAYHHPLKEWFQGNGGVTAALTLFGFVAVVLGGVGYGIHETFFKHN